MLGVKSQSTAIRNVSDAGGPASLLIDPPPGGWTVTLRAYSQRSLARKVQTRAALGLPERRVQIMTGHQAGMWHAGSLAKYIFSHLLSDEVQDGAWSHVVVDQDVNDAGLLTAPTLEAPRLVLLHEALRLGGDGAITRLRASTGDIGTRLSAAAGVEEDSLLSSWRRRVISQRGARIRPTGEVALATIGWTLLLTGLGLRRTRRCD